MNDSTPRSSPGNGAPTGPSARGERRIVTALFCDVANSTALAEELDPEEWAEQIDEAFGYLTDAVTRYEGTVVRLLGDAVLAFFGAPLAHEDDPERAVLAGLSMLEDITPFQARFRREFGLSFDIRVGINTGEVVFGTLASGGDEYTALGDAVNVAARMQQMARPNSVQISADTYGMVATLFDVEPLGDIEVKGKRGAVTAFRVLSYRPPSRAFATADGTAAPLVGRDAELALLRRVVEEFRHGRGQALLLVGETGLGKTRLIDELHNLWREQSGASAHWSEARGISYDMKRPFGVFQQMLRQDIRIDDASPSTLVQSSVARRVHDMSGTSDQRIERAVQTLLDGRPGRSDLPEASEDFQRELFDSVRRFYQEMAERSGLILVFDDLHWADVASVELLTYLMDLAESSQSLIVCALRPERQSAAWSLKQRIETDLPHRVTSIELAPLPADESARLIDALLGEIDAPQSLRDLILAKTEGNPLFVEEVIRALGGSEATGAARTTGQADLVVPDSLQALLTARIDNLDGAARRLLQVASVIGRLFSMRVLEQIVGSESLDLDRDLNTLERVGLIEEIQRTPERRYAFRHELMRDVAYRSILRRDRRTYHRRVAASLEELPIARREESAYQLAYHFREAGDFERALPWAVLAGERSKRLYAVSEALAHYSDAIELAEATGAPADQLADLLVERAGLRAIPGDFDGALADYQAALDLARQDGSRIVEWRALEGVGALWFGRDYEQSGGFLEDALRLAREIGDPQILAQSLLQVGNWQTNTERLHDARESLESARDLFEALGDRRGVAQTEDLLGIVVEFDGDFFGFAAHLERATEIYREIDDRQGLASTLATLSGIPSGAFFDTMVMPDSLLLDEAIELSDEALTVSRGIGWRSGEAYALYSRGMTLASAGKFGAAMESVSRGISIAEELAHNEWLCLGNAALGSIYRDLTHDELAVRHIETAHAHALSGGAPFWISLTTGFLASALVKHGDVQRAEQLLAFMPADLGMRQQGHRHLWMASAHLDAARGDHDSAVSILERLYQTAVHATSLRDLPLLAVVYANVLIAEGRLDEALIALDEALAGLRQRRILPFLWRAHAGRARVFSLVGQPDRAERERAEGESVVRAIAANVDIEELRVRFLSNAMRILAESVAPTEAGRN